MPCDDGGVPSVALPPSVSATTSYTLRFPQSHPANSETPTSDPLYTYDMERDPSDCIGLYPKPGCGKAPTQAGDRGGNLQYATFGLIIIGLAIVFTVIFRNVIRADKRKATEVSDPNQKWSPRD